MYIVNMAVVGLQVRHPQILSLEMDVYPNNGDEKPEI